MYLVFVPGPNGPGPKEPGTMTGTSRIPPSSSRFPHHPDIIAT